MKTKKKTKVVKAIEWLNFGIFPGFVVFCYNMKYEEIMKEFKKKKALYWSYGITEDQKLIDSGNWLALSREITNQKTGEHKKLFYIIIPKTFDFSDYDYAKLAHEVTHICQFYLPHVLDRNKEYEAEAYLHTHLMMQCTKVIRGK
jgi:hypothetical protein